MSTFRQYKHKLRAKATLRKHASEDNWETEEVSRWIANDEGLYDAAYNAVRRGYMDPAGALRSIVEEYGVPDVDFNLVDWDALVAEVDEDTAEQMGYDAQQMLAQDQPGDTYLPEGWTSRVANAEPDWENWPVSEEAGPDSYLEARHGPWKAQWNGGRLMEIYHDESPTPLDAIHAGDNYDWQTYSYPQPPTPGRMTERLRQWADDVGGQYAGEILPYQ